MPFFFQSERIRIRILKNQIAPLKNDRVSKILLGVFFISNAAILLIYDTLIFLKWVRIR